MEEVIFLTEKNEEGRYIARHSDKDIIREATTVRELRESITNLYKELAAKPILVRLYFIKDKYDITFYTQTSDMPAFFC